MQTIPVKLCPEDIEEISTKVAQKLSSGQKADNRPETYTVAEAAKILKCSPTTVRTHIKADLLSAKRVGKAYLITPKDIENYLKKET